jgi:GNAT superfamily N-acetyltransferase
MRSMPTATAAANCSSGAPPTVAAPMRSTAPPPIIFGRYLRGHLKGRCQVSGVLGYYTLSSFGIDAGVVPPEIAKKPPRYPLIPATLLGRLAVDERHHGEGIGEFLLMDAPHRSRAQSGQIAAVAVVVEAIDERAERFYQHFGFIPFPTITGRLFMMKTVKQLFA